MESDFFRLTIIGGGAGAVLLASQLLEISTHTHITIIERSCNFATGVAYSTPYPYHLLNVRAGNMSYSDADPAHFVNWLHAANHNYTASDFVPRKLYGQYLQALLKNLNTRFPDRISCLTDEVIAIEPDNRVVLKSGRLPAADHLVLAVGNFLPATPETISPEIKNTAGYFANPWNFEAFNSIDPDAHILIIGSGLTMTDCVLHLHQRNHRGKISSLCRHGYAPVSHEKTIPVDAAFKNQIPALKNLDDIFAHWMTGLHTGAQPAAMADAFRPYVQQLWQMLNIRDKNRFTDHLRHLWGTVRHRVPESCYAVINSLKEQKQLEIFGGKINRITNHNRGYEIVYTPRKEQAEKQITADVIINCTGPSSRFEKDAPEFLRLLLEQKMVCMDETGLGLAVTQGSEIIAANGTINTTISAIGNLTRGIFWEITAIPEIRRQARNIAEHLTRR